jgi:uncharacterized protein
MNDMDLTDPFCYDVWLEDSLRGVVKCALTHVADFGLSGDHHFYITFSTTDEDVVMASHLKAAHPKEMTIVLQHKFDSLTITDDGFRVTLFFSGRSETLYIPFQALTAFADPSVNFGLHFKIEAIDADENLEEDGDIPETYEDETTTGDVVSLDAFRKTPS